ncbi:sensor histidine kinase [Lactiplantibacillus pentosus]|uniref:sensor histidine kinase n=1 Tax=Lactiplantibacillus pentosus TaxID=1589 RepID=UPI001FD68CFD|nr:sensor histidine kinase [Lactiplantibacillus pentosus]MCJ8180990.1 sensor histidine kinase [Lactiplantibacillus pentosus]
MLLKNHIMQASFAHLIKVYTAIISVMVVLATTVFVAVSIRTYDAEVDQAENTAVVQIGQMLNQNQQVAAQFATQITSSANNLPSITKYFTSSISDYSNYAIDKSIAGSPYFFWPTESRQFFTQHDQVTQVTLRLLSQNKVFVATQDNPGGALYSAKDVHQKFAINAPLINQTTLETDGVLSISFDQHELKRQLAQIRAVDPFQIVVRSDADDEIFYFAGKRVTTQQQRDLKRALASDNTTMLQNYHVTKKRLSSGDTVTTVLNRQLLGRLIIGHVLPLILLGLILLFGLSVGLWLTFRRYQHQFNTIVDTVQAVSDGNLDARVPMNVRPTDLHTLADGINAMLEEIHQHIYTIYQLQIAQQEANRKALQAQINPHFMSNTLEYIRMAALEANQPELANVVYSFAALLRNNTDLSSRTTLKQEVKFIEKYVFLYQVRFPDRLAYQFTVTPDVAGVEIPKFSLQPIVENYFVHGVNFSRGDNALSLKAWRENGLVHVRIVDNGRGLTPAAVTAVNQKIRQPLAEDQQQSIGLQNVYLRLRDSFGDSFQMSISSAGEQGVTVDIQFDDQ